mmetsp:Transcript_21830/g.42379  ORF Transcript_21830/g.42379 Transcript_21830/m.42379 type:complete len:222 (+) Transcript_21830:392-1057(+)
MNAPAKTRAELGLCAFHCAIYQLCQRGVRIHDASFVASLCRLQGGVAHPEELSSCGLHAYGSVFPQSNLSDSVGNNVCLSTIFSVNFVLTHRSLLGTDTPLLLALHHLSEVWTKRYHDIINSNIQNFIRLQIDRLHERCDGRPLPYGFSAPRRTKFDDVFWACLPPCRTSGTCIPFHNGRSHWRPEYARNSLFRWGSEPRCRSQRPGSLAFLDVSSNAPIK